MNMRAVKGIRWTYYHHKLAEDTSKTKNTRECVISYQLGEVFAEKLEVLTNDDTYFEISWHVPGLTL